MSQRNHVACNEIALLGVVDIKNNLPLKPSKAAPLLYLSVCLSACLSVCLSLCLCLCFSLSLCLSPSLCRFISLCQSLSRPDVILCG